MAIAVLAAEYTRIHVACWPNHFIPGNWGMRETSLMTSQNVAYMCKAFVVSAASVNTPEMVDALAASDADRAFLEDPAATGGAAIVAPSGAVIAGPLTGDREGIVYADADLEMTIRGRLVQDFGGHYNRPDVLRLLVNDSPGELVTRVGGDGAPGLDWAAGVEAFPEPDGRSTGTTVG
jgi:aliphatic nitrilase